MAHGWIILGKKENFMRWDYLTSHEFADAVQETGVCVLATGVLEKHSDHLPLGTDYLSAHAIACLAAERTPGGVFPPFYFGQIYEARCFAGTLTLKPSLLLELFQNVLDEIGRNGFKKIVIYNGHGGNHHFLRFLAQCSLAEQKPYSLYVYTGQFSEARQQEWDRLLQTPEHGHACECESGLVFASYPELVQTEKIPAEPATALHRLAHLPANFSGIWWYANYPEHYAGDARPTSHEQGLKLREIEIAALAEFLAAVKADSAVPALEAEFFARAGQVNKP
jgi:creatinine amidohydrolase